MTMIPLHRGIWIDRLENNQEVPIGGSIFGDELTDKIILDFETFAPELTNFRSPHAISAAYAQNKPALETWLSTTNSAVDPYLFYVAHTIQKKVQTLLPRDPNQSVMDRELAHDQRFHNGITLSELADIAVCGESSLLGQYLLQQTLESGYTSAYMGGVASESDHADDISNHSFIVLQAPSSDTYIFDIARPRSQHNFPRILLPDIPFTAERFTGEKNLLIGATEVLQGGRRYFGVGDPNLMEERRIAAKQ